MHPEIHRPLIVTGIGLTTCLGRGVEENWRALCDGETGMRPLQSIDVSDYPVKDGGEVPGAPPDDATEPRERALAFVLEVCTEALRRAQIPSVRAPRPERAGLAIGSSLAASASSPSFWKGYVENGPAAADYAMLRSYDAEPLLDQVCRSFDLHGRTALISNACAAGASSIVVAADWIRLGYADLVIAVGFDLLDVHTFAGFGALGALAAGPLQPFSIERSGMKLSDGFAALVLEAEDHAMRAGRQPIARLLGYGESADAHNLTQPDPEGRGAGLAMMRALDLAGLTPEAIDYINVHATATQSNDLAELKAMRSVFGAGLDTIAIHATKPALGHSLGGAGAVEAVVTSLVLENQYVPATLGLGELEPEAAGLQVASEGRKLPIRCAMTNSFGFGGCNASLILGAP